MAVWAKIVAVFGKIFWGGFWRVWAPKVAVSDFDLLETLFELGEKNSDTEFRFVMFLSENLWRLNESDLKQKN